ncbi:MAG: hypothetical protein IRZ16_19510 [Myxococcaceae bacterium]|nr:hypothetical protein [Myxococcaceae bacterium]
MAIRALRSIGLHTWIAGILISAVCGPLAMWQFFRWARHLVGDDRAFAATALFLVYPFAYSLFGVVYTEALFLALVIPAFLCLERGNVWLATLFGALATACRPVAPAVVVGLVVRQLELRRLRQEPIRAIDFVPALSAVGMTAFMAFLWLRFDDPLDFAHVQAAPGRDHPPGWHTWLKVTWFKKMFPRVRPDIGFWLGMHAALTVGALALCVATKKRLGWGSAAYAFVAVAIPAAGIKDFQGMGRYAMAAFPCILTLSLLIGERPRLRRAAMVTSAAIALYFVVNFARSEWTA